MSEFGLHELPDENFELMPLDQLGMLILRHVADNSEWSIHNALLSFRHQILPREEENQRNLLKRERSEVAQQAVAEAFNWLFNNGLLSRNRPPSLGGGHDANSMFITRAGNKALAKLEVGLRSVTANQMLGDHIHPQLQKARSRFLDSQYSDAVLGAMLTVEARVRRLAEPKDDRTSGTSLMRNAFGDKGPLTDPTQGKGRSDGIRDLFAGVFGVYRNDAAHARNKAMFDDPAEVAEVILLVSLLHRHLDRVEQRLSTQITQTDS